MAVDQMTADLLRENEALRAEVERLRADAARYRWVAGVDAPPHSTRWSRWKLEHYAGFHGGWEPLVGTLLDAAIDAARAKEAGDDN